jgi:hypothetical protein
VEALSTWKPYVGSGDNFLTKICIDAGKTVESTHTLDNSLSRGSVG